MTDDTPASPPSSRLTPQQILAIGAVLGFGAQFVLNQGWISQKTYEWLVSPNTLNAIVAIGSTAITAYLAWATRPHQMIKTTNALKQVDAVIVRPKTAAEIDTKGVVSTLEDAEKAAPAIARRARKVAVQPTAH